MTRQPYRVTVDGELGELSRRALDERTHQAP
jgi:hypothetical protein